MVRRAFTAAGYRYEFPRKTGTAAESVFRQRIVASIDKGIPVLAFGIFGPPECCVVTGYDGEGQTLLG